MDDFEAYIKAIDEDYDADDCIFNGYIYKFDTPQFNKVNRSQYGNGWILNMKLFNIEEIFALYQRKDTVSLKVLIS